MRLELQLICRDTGRTDAKDDVALVASTSMSRHWRSARFTRLLRRRATHARAAGALSLEETTEQKPPPAPWT